MTDPKTWVIAGGLIGALLGEVLRPGPAGWLWGAGGGSIGLGCFPVAGRLLGKFIGEPAGWAIAGPLGLSVGGAILLAAISSNPYGAGVLGAIGGTIAGAICGSVCGTVSFLRRSRTSPAERRGVRPFLEVGLLIVIFLSGIAGIVFVIARSS